MMEATAAPEYLNDSFEFSNQSDVVPPYVRLRQSLNTMSVVVYCLAFVLGVLGNGLVIWVTGFKMKKTVNTIWIMNLAVADFLFTAFLPLSITYTLSNFHWPFGRFLCKLNSAINSLNMFASVYILMVISVDRCLCVVKPIWAQNNRNVRKATYVCLAVWPFAVILSIPVLVFRDTGPSFIHNETIICFNNYNLIDDFSMILNNNLSQLPHQAMTISRLVLGFVIPFSVIISCYAVIIHRIWTSPSLAGQSTRTFKIIAAVIVAFFLCWAPYHSISLLELISIASNHRFSSVIPIVSPIATSLAFFNSCLNPLLYVFMGRDFKDKMCQSLPKVLESALKEDDSPCKTVETGDDHDKSDTEL